MQAYRPADFWESRYQKFDISTSGHINLPYVYNTWLYKMKIGKILKSLISRFNVLEDKNVLELGCGTGAYLDMWRGLNIKSMTGVDIAPSTAINLKKQNPDYNFYCQDISDENIAVLLGENKYDIVTAIGVLVHIIDDEDMRSALRNISRMVTDNGLVLISDYMLSGDQPERDATYMKFRNLEIFKKDLYEAGLELISAIPFYYFMINPIDTPSMVERHFLNQSHFLLKRLIRRHPNLSGRLLYYIDTMITAMLTDGPSEELFICKKREVH